MIKIILLLVCLLMCGCENSIITDEAKYKDNAFKDNKEIEPVSDSIANDINKLLEENNLKATFKFVKLENVDDNINVYYETKNGVELLIDYNKENKLDKIILTAQIDTTKMGYKLTDEYLMSKTFLLKTKELNINEEDFNTLSECTKGIEPKACTTDKITVKEANEATSYIPRFVILINN